MPQHPITQNITIAGATDSGDIHNVPVTPDGNLRVAIHEPTLPFGSINVSSLSPEFQSDAVYGCHLNS